MNDEEKPENETEEPTVHETLDLSKPIPPGYFVITPNRRNAWRGAAAVVLVCILVVGAFIGYTISDRNHATDYADGAAVGYDSGYADGEAAGTATGYDNGYTEGETAGIAAGYDNGYADAEDALKSDRASLAEDQAALAEDRAALEEDQTALAEDRASLEEDQTALAKDRASLEEGQAALEADRAALQKEQAALAAAKASSNSSNSTSGNSNSTSGNNVITDTGGGRTVYITNTGTKYHNSSCRYLKKSKIAVSIDWAKANHYEACKVCGG